MWTFVFILSGTYLGVELLGRVVTPCVTLGSCQTVFKVAARLTPPAVGDTPYTSPRCGVLGCPRGSRCGWGCTRWWPVNSGLVPLPSSVPCCLGGCSGCPMVGSKAGTVWGGGRGQAKCTGASGPPGGLQHLPPQPSQGAPPGPGQLLGGEPWQQGGQNGGSPRSLSLFCAGPQVA